MKSQGRPSYYIEGSIYAPRDFRPDPPSDDLSLGPGLVHESLIRLTHCCLCPILPDPIETFVSKTRCRPNREQRTI